MAKFGKKLRQRKIKEWEEHYIDYKPLSTSLKKIIILVSIILINLYNS